MNKFIMILAMLTCSSVFSKYIHGDFDEFLTLEEVVFEKAYIIEGKINKGKLVQATNYGNDNLCIISIIKESLNVENAFFNDGKMIVNAGQTAVLGGFLQANARRSWYAKWRHIKTKNLSRCK